MNTAENTEGIRVPPEKPCSTRQATSSPKLPLAAQPAEAATNRLMAVTNSHRIVRSRVNRPVSGIATTSAMR